MCILKQIYNEVTVHVSLSRMNSYDIPNTAQNSRFTQSLLDQAQT
jgi:hypothetical protein